jgi:hypothetical protein
VSPFTKPDFSYWKKAEEKTAMKIATTSAINGTVADKSKQETVC